MLLSLSSRESCQLHIASKITKNEVLMLTIGLIYM